MSNNDNLDKMEVIKLNSSNKSTTNKDPGIYTCPTCNALFTCLKFYQQHVIQHAESNGIKLFCCNKCRYSTEVVFQYNWHQMSHKGAPAHSCSVCEDRSSDNCNSNNHLNGDDSLATGKSTRKSQQNGNSNKKVKYNNSKSSLKEDEEDDEEDEDDEDSDADSNAEESDESEEDDEDESGDSEDEEDEEEEVKKEDLNPSKSTNSKLPNVPNNQTISPDEEMSDDEDDLDDEEEEIESEEDAGENNESPEDYLLSQNLNNNNESGTVTDMQNPNSHLNNNSTDNLIDQGPPYLKSNITPELPADLLLNDTGIICNKGRGKGNRKSRTQKQMGGQVDDEFSQLRRKFHCSHCGKSFKTKSHLQRHILTHTGEKPYHCNRCGAKFNQSSSLRNHIIALHTKEYPHFCNHCNKGFLMPALLLKHLQTSHKDLPHQEIPGL